MASAPTPSAPALQTSPTPTPTPAPPAPTPTPTLRQKVDALSPAEVEKAFELLKTNYLAPEAVSPEALLRAGLEGILARLAPGAVILPGPAPVLKPSPFRSELMGQDAGYVRLGSLEQGKLAELDAALANFRNNGVKSVILDLRDTPASNDFAVAAELAKRFVAKGKPLFSIRKQGQEQKFVSDLNPLYSWFVVILANEQTGGAPEVLAATLRQQTRSMLLGQTTMGQGAEFAELPLDGKVLRLAVAPVLLPDNQSVYPKGLKPDLAVELDPETRRELLRLELEQGVVPFVYETERPKRNEAALVARTNPEIDTNQIAQRKNGKTPVRDLEIQRALDLIVTINVYESKPAGQ